MRYFHKKLYYLLTIKNTVLIYNTIFYRYTCREYIYIQGFMLTVYI